MDHFWIVQPLLVIYSVWRGYTKQFINTKSIDQHHQNEYQNEYQNGCHDNEYNNELDNEQKNKQLKFRRVGRNVFFFVLVYYYFHLKILISHLMKFFHHLITILCSLSKQCIQIHYTMNGFYIRSVIQ